MAVALRQLNPIHKKGAIKFFFKVLAWPTLHKEITCAMLENNLIQCRIDCTGTTLHRNIV